MASFPEIYDNEVTRHYKIVVVTSLTGDKPEEELIANPQSENQLLFNSSYDKLGKAKTLTLMSKQTECNPPRFLAALQQISARWSKWVV